MIAVPETQFQIIPRVPEMKKDISIAWCEELGVFNSTIKIEVTDKGNYQAGRNIAAYQLSFN